MKKHFIVFLSLLMLYCTEGFAGGWVTFEQYCNDLLKSEGIDCTVRPRVTGNSLLSKWAGEVDSIYGEDIDGKAQVLKFKVQITWTADPEKYPCLSYMVLNKNEVKDFKFRSLAMRECNN